MRRGIRLILLGLRLCPDDVPAPPPPPVSTPYWHCILHDPYERTNFWSHFVPGVLLLLMAAAASAALIPGHHALAVWGVCSGSTHLLSALTHVYPDSHSLVRVPNT